MAEESSGRKILVTAKYFSEGHGGAPETILLLARHLAPLGIRMDVVSKLGFSMDVGRLQQLPSERSFAGAASSLPESFKAYDALFIVGSWNPQALVHALRSLLAKVPIFYAPKGCLCRIEFERLRDFRRVPYLLLFEWWLLLFATGILFESPTEQNNLVVPRLLWRKKAVCLPEPFLGAKPANTTRPSPDPAKPLTFGFLAEISPRKGLLELVDGFAHFRSNHPEQPACLRIGGRIRPGSEAYAERVRSKIRNSGLGADVQWDGPVGLDSRSRFYDEMDFFLCPSRFESFGLTPLEALWHGTPAAAGPNLGVLEYIPPGAPVLVFPDLSPGAISHTIAGMVRDRRRLAADAAEWRGREIPAISGLQSALQYSRILLGTRVPAEKGHK